MQPRRMASVSWRVGMFHRSANAGRSPFGKGGGEDVEVVAADAAQDAGEATADLVGILADDLPDAAIDAPVQRARLGAALPLGRAARAELGGRTVGEHDAQAADVVERLAVDDG